MIPKTGPVEGNRSRQVIAYTVALFVVALLALLTVFSHQMLFNITLRENPESITLPVFRFLQAFEFTIFAAATVAGILRMRRSPLARPMTAALSIVLVLWVPIGTAVFLWWLLSVRRREAAGPGRTQTASASQIPPSA